jgi:hypothetical protein
MTARTQDPRGPQGFFYPFVDYRAHPAFAGIEVPEFADEQGLHARINRIDAVFADLVRDCHGDEAGLAANFGARLAPLIADLEAFVTAGLPYPESRRWISNALPEAIKELADAALLFGMSKQAMPLGAKSEGIFSSLTDSGMALLNLQPADKKKLLASVGTEIAALRARANETDRIVATIARYSAAGVQLDRIFRDAGVYPALAAYKGDEVAFTGFSLEYSHDRQAWWKGCYEDVGLPPARTTYMHYDYGCRYPKAIVTLSDVRVENGATGFIPGSHRAQRSDFVHTFIKAMDLKFGETFAKDAEHGYHRKQFSEPTYRKFFLALPAALRGCSHFGEDILDGTPLSEELLSREVRLTSDKGDCIVFDGDYGIHRGAHVQKGERLAFQVIFKVCAPDGLARQTVMRGRQLARRWLDSLKRSH